MNTDKIFALIVNHLEDHANHDTGWATHTKEIAKLMFPHFERMTKTYYHESDGLYYNIWNMGGRYLYIRADLSSTAPAEVTYRDELVPPLVKLNLYSISSAK